MALSLCPLLSELTAAQNSWTVTFGKPLRLHPFNRRQHGCRMMAILPRFAFRGAGGEKEEKWKIRWKLMKGFILKQQKPKVNTKN
jgi:hypothetical protein